ncbi:golgi apparatus membrane protein [Trichophyton mentagrophytes]|nr:golgi apparatus membrane protein [Trichophyton mentagrophytes]
MTLAEEFRSRNFSIYAQWLAAPTASSDSSLYPAGETCWTGILSMLICFAVGISNLFRVPSIILAFSIVCLACSPVILFIEVPLLLRICPTSSKFDAFIRRFASNTMRGVIYLAMSVIQWLSLVSKEATSLIAAAVFLLFTAIFYALAAAKGQEFTGSKTLGGPGVAQMMV